MSNPKMKPNVETKIPDNSLQHKEDLANQQSLAEKLAEKMHDQFLNEKAIDIEALAHRVFAANPAVVDVKGEAYIVHKDGSKTLIKPEDVHNKDLKLAEGDVIVTAPEGIVTIEAAGKQCYVEGNNQLPIEKAVLITIESNDSSVTIPCPGVELVEDELHNFTILEHWDPGKSITMYDTLTGTVSGDYPGFLTDTFLLSGITTTPDFLSELRGGGLGEVEVGPAPIGPALVLGGPEAAPLVPPIAAPITPGIPDDGNQPPIASNSTANAGEDNVLFFSMAMFNSTDADAGDTVESVTITSLPVDGSLEFFDASANGGLGAWVPVSVNQVIAASEIDAGNLRFTPEPNESGDDSFSLSGVGNLAEDYASFGFTLFDGVEPSNEATMAINIAPIADDAAFDTSNLPIQDQVFSPLYLVDSHPGSTEVYTVEFNNTTNEAELTTLFSTGGYSNAQMAVTQDGSGIYLLDADVSTFGVYDTTSNTFNPLTVSGGGGLQVSGMTFFADNNGNEFLYVADSVSNTLAAYDVSGGTIDFNSPNVSYGSFDLVDVFGVSLGIGNFDFNGGDIIFDEFGQAYAVSNSIGTSTGGLVRLDLDNGTAHLVQSFSEWSQGSGTGLANVTSLHYDSTTQTFAIGIESNGANVDFNAPGGPFPVDSAFILLDIDGNYIFPAGSSTPTVDMTAGGSPFTHTAGDTGSADTAQYIIPVDVQLTDIDGSEALINLQLDFNDSDTTVDGAAVVYNGQIINNGSIINLSGLDINGNPILTPIQATVSVDSSTQIWTITINPGDIDPATVTLSGDFAVRFGISQSETFNVDVSSTSMELSNASSAASTYSYSVPINFTPVINSGAMLIIHDEDSLNQPGTDDVDFTSVPAAIATMESNNGLVAGDRIGAAQTDQGIFAYQAPGGDYITDIRLTQLGDAAITGLNSGIQTDVGNNDIFLYQDPSDNNLLIGREGIGSGVGAVADPLGTIVLAIYLDGGSSQFGSPNDSLWLVTYQPVENASAPAIISNLIHLTVETNDGDIVTSTDNINVEIRENDNDAPVTSDSTFVVGEDLTYTFTMADFPSTDADVGDLVEFVRFDTLPVSGTIQLNGSNISAGQSISVSDINSGLLTYTGAFDQSGDPSFGVPGTGDQQNQYAIATFSVSDGQVFSTPSQMSVEVTPIADAPIMGVGLTTTTSRFSKLYLSDAGPIIANPDFDDPTTPNDQASLGGQAVAGAALYTIVFNDHGTADLSDDTVDLTFQADFWSLQNPNADQSFLNERVDGRLENPLDPLAGPIPQDPDMDGQTGLPPPPSRDVQLSDVGYTSAAIAAVLDGSQIFALDDARVDNNSRLDFGFAEVDTTSGAVTGFGNLSGPDLDAYTPDGIGHSANSTTGAQGMTFFGGGGEQQIFVYNVATDQVQAFDISNDSTPGLLPTNPFDPANLKNTFGAGSGVGFTIIGSRDLFSGADATGFGDDFLGGGPGGLSPDGIGDHPDGVGDTAAPDGIGDYNGFTFDITGGDIIFDQYDQAYIVANSRKNVNDLGGTNQVGGFAKLNLEDGTAILLNDFRDTFNLFNDSNGTSGGTQIATGMVGAGGLFLDAGADIDGDGIADGLFYISLAGAQRFSPDGTLASDQQVSSTFIILDRQGNIVAFPDMQLNGVDFQHAGGGDGTSTLQIEYTLPIVAAVSDTDGSESLTQLRVDLNDVLDNFVNGGVIRFAGQELVDSTGAFLPGTGIDLDGIVNGVAGTDNVHATLVSYNAINQIYTFDIDQGGGIVSSISDMNGVTVTADGNQTTDFSMNVEATSTELSNGDTATGNYDVFVDRGGLPQIDAVGSISIDETPGVQTTGDGFGSPVDDVALTALTGQDSHNLAEAIINNMQTITGSGTPDTLAHINPGEMLYTVANSFAGDVTMTDASGNAFAGADSGLTSVSGNTIFLYTFSYNFVYTDPVTLVTSTVIDDNIILGREGTGDVANPLGNVVFSLFYDEGLAQFGAGNDSLWLTMYDTILHEFQGESLSIDNLIYLKVFDGNLSSSTVSADAIRVTFVDDITTGGTGDIDGPDPFPPAAPLMMMSAFSAGDGPVSNEDSSSSDFMTVSNDDSSSLLFSTVSNDDASTVNDDSGAAATSNDANSSPTQDSSDAGSDQALTNEMVFSTENQSNPVQAEQQATLDSSGSTEPQQEVAQQQQQQEQASDPSSAGSPDAISQSMQEADQQAQASSGGG